MAEVRAEMVANVWKVVAAEGDHVDDGDTLVILESMKMEIPVLAEGPGVVTKLHVAEGDAVEEGDLIAIIGWPDQGTRLSLPKKKLDLASQASGSAEALRYTPVGDRGQATSGSVTTLTRYGTSAAKARRSAGAMSAGAVTSSPAPPRARTTSS